MLKMHEMWGHSEVVPLVGQHRWPEQVGIELEVEDCNVREGFGSWTVHDDPSLRNGIEFVLRRPCAGNALSNALTQFYGLNMNYTAGPRTSTHIHVNARDLTMDGVRSMILIMYTIEDAVFTMVGESRKWASYAMPLSEMGAERMRQIMTCDDKHRDRLVSNLAPARNQERYYGFNVAALKRHGTVEFRYFPGGPRRDELEDWLDMVTAVKVAGRTHTPSALVEMIQNPEQMAGFLYNAMPKHADRLLRICNAEALFTKFEEAAQFCIDPDALERRDALHYRNPLFTDFILSKVLAGDEARASMAAVIQQFDVMTQADWTYYLRRAMEQDMLVQQAVRKMAKNQRLADVVAADPVEGEPMVIHQPPRDAGFVPFQQPPLPARQAPRPAEAYVRVIRERGESDNAYLSRVLRANNL